MAVRVEVAGAAEMEALGARLASLLRAGDLVILDGPLGAGKTTFARGVGAALGARGPITSPTFVLARTHPTAAGVPLVHVDAYRLGSALELDDLDLDLEGSIVLAEWGAGKLDGAAESWIEVAIERPPLPDPGEPEGGGDEPRTVTITGRGPRWAGLDAELA